MSKKRKKQLKNKINDGDLISSMSPVQLAMLNGLNAFVKSLVDLNIVDFNDDNTNVANKMPMLPMFEIVGAPKHLIDLPKETGTKCGKCGQSVSLEMMPVTKCGCVIS